MIYIRSIALLVLIAASTNGLPLLKRIAQIIDQSTHDWEQACLKAGGGLKCNPVSVAAFSTLLATPGPCEQQDAADNMIDLAKSLGSPSDMIRLTQLFVQQPRNTIDGLSVPYCQKAPRHSELQGLFQCQFAGANPKVFHGNVPVGGPGTIPFGLTEPVNPLGTCHASKVTIPNGQQLEQIIQDPGVDTSVSTAQVPTTVQAPVDSADNVEAPPPVDDAPLSSTDDSVNGSSTPASGSAPQPSFALQNGKDSQALNRKFAGLTKDSHCNLGDDACIGGQFAQCVSGQFVITGCGAGTICAAVPLIDKAGTALVCTTEADALSRIAVTGATGGLTGSG